MLCVGFEGTAHTIGVGIVDDDKIIANELRTFHPEAGIHPREAANFHAKHMPDVLKDALKAGIVKAILLNMIGRKGQ